MRKVEHLLTQECEAGYGPRCIFSVSFWCVFFSIFVITGVPGEALPVTSEEDVFDYIGMAYKKPSERNMWGHSFEVKIISNISKKLDTLTWMHVCDAAHQKGGLRGWSQFWVQVLNPTASLYCSNDNHPGIVLKGIHHYLRPWSGFR